MVTKGQPPGEALENAAAGASAATGKAAPAAAAAAAGGKTASFIEAAGVM